MNGQRDIERTLEAWFLDGPSVMPDRLFDAVFDQVERVPQRRLAHLQLRLTEMNPRIRLFTVLAAALLVIVAAIAIGAGSRGLVRSTPPPSTAPSPAATALAGTVPANLIGTWMGGPGGLSGLEPRAGMAVGFNGAFYMTQSDLRDERRVQSDAAVTAEQLVLTSRPDVPDCDEGDVGTYTFRVSPSGQVLTLDAVSDDCAARLGALAGSWERMDCPQQNDNCLGVIDAGEHASQFFDPFLGNGERWVPKYDLMHYTTPAAWQNVQDNPGYYTLSPNPAPGETALYFFSDVVVLNEEDPCNAVPATDIGESPLDIVTWLRSAPGVIATGYRETTVGGRQAWRLDVSMDPSWDHICSWDTKPGRGLFTDRDPGDGFHWGLGPTTKMRLWFFDNGHGRALLIDAETDQAQSYWTDFVAQATSIVDSISFKP